MTADNLRERLEKAGREGPLDPFLTAELAIPVVAEYLMSDAPVERVARASEGHHILFGKTDADGNTACACGQWMDGDAAEGWDEHIARAGLAALAAALVAEGEGDRG